MSRRRRWLIDEFKLTGRKKDLKPFSPEFVFEALRRYNIDIMRGRQEDAEGIAIYVYLYAEFLIIFLDIIDRELNSLASDGHISNAIIDNDAEEWTSVDRKHPKVNTRTVSLARHVSLPD